MQYWINSLVESPPRSIIAAMAMKDRESLGYCGRSRKLELKPLRIHPWKKDVGVAPEAYTYAGDLN